jgi:hypothetical protein
VGGLSDHTTLLTDGHEADTKERAEKALTLLDRIQQGDVVSSGDVAKLAAEVLADLPPLLAAARRFLQQIGSGHEATSAVSFLAQLASLATRELQDAAEDAEPPAESPRQMGRLR